MIPIMHNIDTNLCWGKRKEKSSPPGIHINVKILSNKECCQDYDCFCIHPPIKSSQLMRNNFFNSFFQSIIELAFPWVKIKIVSNITNPVFLAWSLFGETKGMIALPHRRAVSSSSIYNEITSRMYRQKCCEVINFTSHNNPKRTFSVMLNYFFPSVPSILRIFLLLNGFFLCLLLLKFRSFFSGIQYFYQNGERKTNLKDSHFKLLLSDSYCFVKIRKSKWQL